MALNRDTLSIPLAGGVDTKTDPKQVGPGKLLSLTNGVFQNPESLNLRDGYTQIASSGATTGRTIATYKDSLVELDGTTVYEYSPTLGSWPSTYTKTAASLAVTPIVASSTNQTVPDSCQSGSIALYAWEDSGGGVRYSIFDTSTNASIIVNATIGSTYTLPRCCVVGTNLVIFANNTTNNHIDYFAFPIAHPTTGQTTATLTTNFGTIYEIIPGPSNGFYFLGTVKPSILIQTVVRLYDSSFAQTASRSAFSEVDGVAFALSVDSSLNVWAAMISTAAGVNYTVMNGALSSTVLAETLISADVGRNVTLAQVAATSYWVVYEMAATDAYNNYLKQSVVTSAGVVGTVSVYLRSVGLASKAFLYNSVPYVLTTHQSGLQSTYFLAQYSTGQIVVKIAPSDGGGLTSKSLLPSVAAISSTVFSFPYVYGAVTTVVNGVVSALKAVNSAQIDFTYKPRTLELGNDLMVNGGVVSQYDGASVVEQNFNLYPEYLRANFYGSTNTQFFPLGGALGVGTYGYEATYEAADNQGQISRSTPSPNAVEDTIPQPSTYFTIAVTTSSASHTLTSAGSGLLLNLGIGYGISGSGIPTGTYITAIDYSTGDITMSQNATASASITATITPEYEFSTAATYPSTGAIYSVTAGTYYQISAEVNSSSAVITVPDVSYLAVGVTITDPTGLYWASPVTVLSISGNTVTLSSASGAVVPAVPRVIILRVSYVFSGTSTAGNPDITAVSATQVAFLRVGYGVTGLAGFAGTPRIVSISGTTVTMSSNGSGGAVSGIMNAPAGFYLRVGHVVTTDITNTATTGTIKTLSIGADPSGASARLDYTNYTMETGDPELTAGVTVVQNTYATGIVTDTLRVTQRTGIATPEIVLYRTTADGSVFRRVMDPSVPFLNDPTVDTRTYIDLTPDSTLIGNQLLYTTGGEVDNTSPPASNLFAQFKNRAIAVPSENAYSWWYSKQVLPGFPVEFSDSFVQNIDQRGGPITAVGVMDDKLIFFKDNHIFFIVGDGPSPAGTDNDFIYPQLLSTSSGCPYPDSVALIPMGIMYQSKKGIYLLDRSLAVKFIGADVEAYTNAATVVSNQVLPDTTRVRFILSNGTALEFDYYINQWSVFSNHSGVSTCIYQNRFCYLNSAGRVFQDSATTYTDNGSAIVLSYQTPWLSFAKVQGFERVRRLLVLGTYQGPHTFQVDVAVDFDPTIVQTTVITAASGSPEQYLIHMARQKCEAMQFTVTMTPTAPLSAGMVIENMALEVGIKKGLNKMPATKQYG